MELVSNCLLTEIVSNYTPSGQIQFGSDNNDIRTNVFNFDNPICSKTVNNIELKITNGLIRNKRKTYLLYIGKILIGESYSIDDIKTFVETNLINF